jgi:peroxiredoxin
MTLTKTPICNFGEKAKDFNLLSTEKKKMSLDMVKGDNGTLVMFICNHCPYVKAVIKDIVEDVKFLEDLGIKSVAIMSNDVKNYPEDSFENMISFSKLHNFSFPYLIDDTQKVAKDYDAVCTPDFFGYNKNLELQYRGRIRELKDLKPVFKGDSDLRTAMKLVAKSEKGPKNQIPSMGCNIKWFK